MNTPIKASAPVLSKPTLVVLIVGAVLLPITIFSLLKWSTPFHRGGVEAELSVVHIERHGGENRQFGLFAFRDGVYFDNEVTFGFLSITSTCRQYKGRLPQKYSMATVRPIIESEGFNSLAGRDSRRTGDGWYIRVWTNSRRKCFFLNEEEAAQNRDFAPIMAWFNGLKNNRSENTQFVDCSNEGTDFDHWCDD